MNAMPATSMAKVTFSKHSRTSRSPAELLEARDHLVYFRQWTFENPENFRSELRHLVTGNSGAERQRLALFALQPRFRGNVRARIVSLLVDAWEVPIIKALEIYNGLPVDQQAKLNAIVDAVIAEARADLPDEILLSDLPIDEWNRAVQDICAREAGAVKSAAVQPEATLSRK